MWTEPFYLTRPELSSCDWLAGRRGDGNHCDLCGSSAPAVRCDQCSSQIFCYSCDDMYHRHPKRQTHARKVRLSPGRRNLT